MKWRTIIQILVWISNFESTVNEDINDKECQESYLCTPIENCQYYQEQLNEITETKRIETKNEILAILR